MLLHSCYYLSPLRCVDIATWIGILMLLGSVCKYIFEALYFSGKNIPFFNGHGSEQLTSTECGAALLMSQDIIDIPLIHVQFKAAHYLTNR